MKSPYSKYLKNKFLSYLTFEAIGKFNIVFFLHLLLQKSKYVFHKKLSSFNVLNFVTISSLNEPLFSV